MSRFVLVVAMALALPAMASAQFTYDPAGTLAAGSGMGRVDTRVWVPGIRFPIQNSPAYANSQVYSPGGAHPPAGSSGGQCSAVNYSYPWHDNYCETRGWAMPLCPATTGHQGQDIRPGTCMAGMHPAVAVADGDITSIGTYTVYLTRADGTRFDYLHMSNVAVTLHQHVTCGTVLGRVSNVFGGTATTTHLHFNFRQAVAGIAGQPFIPGYMSLVTAYERLLAGDTMMCGMPTDGGVDAGRDAGRDGGHDAGPPTCRSATLARNVPVGACVQVGPERRECGASCGWYQCTASGTAAPAWTCSDPAMCTGMRFPNTSCGTGGARCHSSTLGRDVEHGECVQVSYAGCGATSCAWYRCSDGAWTCSDSTACSGTRYPAAACGRDGGMMCAMDGSPCDVDADCCMGQRCIANACRNTATCGAEGTTCTSGAMCCGGLSCLPQTFGATARQCCNASAGTSCRTDSDCCGEMTCASGLCVSRTNGQSCAHWAECASFNCVGGTCQ